MIIGVSVISDGLTLLILPAILTDIVRPDKNLLIQEKNLPPMPNIHSLVNSIEWSTTSKVLEKPERSYQQQILYQPIQQPYHISPATDPQHSYLYKNQTRLQTTDH